VSARNAFRLLSLALLLAAALVASIAFGAAELPLRAVIDALSGGGEETTRTIVVNLRLPRAVLAILVGGALGLAGAVFQALLRNPLAEPYVLGVSGGAAVGAVAAVVLGWNLRAPWSLRSPSSWCSASRHAPRAGSTRACCCWPVWWWAHSSTR